METQEKLTPSDSSCKTKSSVRNFPQSALTRGVPPVYNFYQYSFQLVFNRVSERPYFIEAPEKRMISAFGCAEYHSILAGKMGYLGNSLL